MNHKFKTRETMPDDQMALKSLYKKAFSDEDLYPLVKKLLHEKDKVISLAMDDDGTLVGHIIFTICHIDESNQKVALLGPVAVAPEFQKRGIGSALIKDNIAILQQEGIKHIYVLGDPAYYGRFGFKTEHDVKTPYDLPEEWLSGWQSLNLTNEEPSPKGLLTVPKPWLQESLWLP